MTDVQDTPLGAPEGATGQGDAPLAPDPLAAPAPVPAAASDAQEIHRAAAVTEAQRASRSLPSVRRADIAVTGAPEAPILEASVTVSPRADFSAAVEEFMDSVVTSMETTLGQPFARHQVEFSIGLAHPGVRSEPAPAQVLEIV